VGHLIAGVEIHQRLVEQRIAEEFALSRTPVREALRRLEAEGLVQSEPNRGAIVRDLTTDDLADLYDLRARLEAYAAELAAVRIDPREVEELDAAIADFDEALTAEQLDAIEATRVIADANRRIHATILAAARHDRLGQLLERTVDVPLSFQAFRQFDRAETERSHLFHQLIRDAIVAGDASRASALRLEHVLQGRDVLVAHLA
jgi:DNA-binding GntR family transcriptional regulator